MAAGVIYQTVTTTSGESVELAFYVDDTGTPTTWIPVRISTNASGSPVAFGSGANGATVPRVALATDSPGVIATGTQGSPSSAYISSVVAGDIAHDAVDSGNPAKQGGRAVAGLSGITLVAAADRTDSLHGIDGAQYVRPHCGLEDLVSNETACTSGANTSIITAQGSGVKFYLMGGMLYNNGSTNGACLITDGNGGTTKLKVPFPASTGTVFTLPVPIGFSANTAVYADPTGSDTIDVTLYGFKSKV